MLFHMQLCWAKMQFEMHCITRNARRGESSLQTSIANADVMVQER
jgi:hypothetical protein